MEKETPTTQKKSDPFKYIGAINQGRDVELESDFNSFLTNRAFSYHLDTVAIANEANQYPAMDPQMHFDYMRAMIRPGKRFSKWHKPKTHPDALVLSQYFGITLKRAYEYVPLYSRDEINQIIKELKANDQ